MGRIGGILERIRRLSRREIERQVTDELRAHVEELVRENVEAGMTPPAARADAERRFGDARRLRAQGVAIRRGAQRDRRTRDLWGGFREDIGYALRVTGRTPGFSFVTISTLALGLGAAAAVLAVLDAVLLRPLPYGEPDRLVSLREVRPNGRTMYLSQANLLDWRRANRVFTDIAAIDAFPQAYVNLTGGAEARRVPSHRVSAAFFEVLDVDAALGRTLLPEDDAPGAAAVAVLGHALWVREFGGDPGVIGRSVLVDEEPHTVVGVMPRGFTFYLSWAGEPDLWRPGPLPPDNDTVRGARTLDAVARLRPGVAIEAAQEELDAIALSLAEDYPEANRGRLGTWGASVVPLHDRVVGDIQDTLLVLCGAVALLLLIAWINVTNLLLSQTTVRSREIAIRTALGAGRWRVARQFLTHAFLLSAAGGLAGIALARLLIPVLIASAPGVTYGGLELGTGFIPLFSRLDLTAWVVVMTIVTTIVTAGVCGVAPALLAAGRLPGEALKSGGKGGGRSRGPISALLASLEVALALVLVIGVGLLVDTMRHISAIPSGYDAERADLVRIQMATERYSVPTAASDGRASSAQWRALTPAYQTLVGDVVRDISALPGVEAAGAATMVPAQSPSYAASIHVEGLEREGARVARGVEVHGAVMPVVVTPGYFRALDIRLVAGRTFTSADDAASPPVVLVSEQLIDYYELPDLVGRTILLADGTEWRRAEVVGMVESTLGSFGNATLTGERPSSPIVFLPYSQPAASYGQFQIRGQLTMNFVARRSPGAAPVVDAMRALVQRGDPETPITYADGFEAFIAAAMGDRRFPLLLIGILAVVSSLLALSGVYGVVSFDVGQRVHEIGVRMALGARADAVVRMVVREGAKVALLGALVGVAIAMGSTRFLSQWLFGVSPTDPVVLTGLAIAMVGVASVAAWVPARRAARVDPVESLAVE